MMVWAGLFYEVEGGRVLVRAMPVLITVLCVLALAYRYYSAFLAAKVAGLGIVVVKALGGEEVKLARGMQIKLPAGAALEGKPDERKAGMLSYRLPPGCEIRYDAGEKWNLRPEAFEVLAPKDTPLEPAA